MIQVLSAPEFVRVRSCLRSASLHRLFTVGLLQHFTVNLLCSKHTDSGWGGLVLTLNYSRTGEVLLSTRRVEALVQMVLTYSRCVQRFINFFNVYAHPAEHRNFWFLGKVLAVEMCL